MPVANAKSFPIGTPVLTINSVTYITNSFSIKRPAKVTQVTDNAGAPLGTVIQTEFATLSAELQLAVVATALPTIISDASTTGTFTYTDTQGGGAVAETWDITEVSEPFQKLDQRVVQISAIKRY